MTKVLYLLRHAKAANSVPDDMTKDHARALAARGHKDSRRMATAMATAMAARLIIVDQVYCSTSKRTRETLAYVREALEHPPVSFRDALYLAKGDDLIAFIQALPDSISNVMLIGHNPGLHEAALALISRAGRGQVKALDLLRAKYPTAALCALAFDVPTWKKVIAGMGTLSAFIRPRDLEKKKTKRFAPKAL